MAAIYGLSRPKSGPTLCVRAFAKESNFKALGLLLITEQGEITLMRMINEARYDKDVAHRLLNELRSRYRKEGIEIPRVKRGLYCVRCRNGPVLVFHLDEEGYGYFAFAQIKEDTQLELDREENGFLLTRSYDEPGRNGVLR